MVFSRGRFPPYYPASKPIPVEGGLASSKQRGAMADAWWSKRFVEILQSYGLGGRMARGRKYARAGQVVSLDVEPGVISARVQGSRPNPYSVEISHVSPTADQWGAIEAGFADRIGMAAELMAGEVPVEVEELFESVGVPLVPHSWRSFHATCSCPDDGDPCKHTASVLYVFADQLDDDPWLLLRWHGRSREQLLDRLRLAGAPNQAAEDGLAPWWPLRPEADADPTPPVVSPGLAIPIAAAPDPPDMVLRRCQPTELRLRGVDLVDLLGVAYEAFADAEQPLPESQ